MPLQHMTETTGYWLSLCQPGGRFCSSRCGQFGKIFFADARMHERMIAVRANAYGVKNTHDGHPYGINMINVSNANAHTTVFVISVAAHNHMSKGSLS